MIPRKDESQLTTKDESQLTATRVQGLHDGAQSPIVLIIIITSTYVLLLHIYFLHTYYLNN